MINNTVKNSASNSPIKQALQAKSGQLLPVIIQALSERAYSDIAHQRISQQCREASIGQTQESNVQNIRQSSNQSSYQGLTRAHHSEYGSVMIKWEISGASDVRQNISDLNHEISVLQALSVFQNIQSTITLPVFDSHGIDIQVLGQPQRLTVLVMPHYVNGSLSKLLNQQHHSLLNDQQKYHLIVQSAQLILNLHKAGWLHNDIKPSNFLFNDKSTTNGNTRNDMPELLLTDFALAQRIDCSDGIGIAGTLAYLAPERWQGQKATIQSDIYAFGVMMVEILTGKRPFQVSAHSNDKLKAWAIQHCQQSIPTLPSEYSHYQYIIDKALAKRVERRYKDLDKVLIDLRLLENH